MNPFDNYYFFVLEVLTEEECSRYFIDNNARKYMYVLLIL